MRTFNHYSLIIVLFAVLTLASCSKNEKKETVIMGYLPMISSLTYFVAVDRGYFMDEGLIVEGIPITTSNAIAESLILGDIDIGVELSVVPLLRQIADNDSPPAKIFSVSMIESEGGFDSVIVNNSSEIQNLADLSGKTVAVFPGTTAENTFNDIFTKKYPNIVPPTIVRMSPANHLSALSTGDVDALHAYEPFLSIGLLQMEMRRIHTSLYAEQMKPLPSPIGVAAINSEWSENNKELAKKAIAALDKAAEFIGKYPSQAQLIASEYTGIDPDIAPDMNFMPMSVSSAINIEGLEKYITILLDINELDQKPNVSKVVYENK